MRFLAYLAVVAIAVAMHQPVGAQNNADFDGDGTVGFSDFLAFAGQFGTQRGDGRYQAKYDLNSDGMIDFADFLLFASSYGSTIPTDGGGSEIVEIPDPNLRAEISRPLRKARGAPITRADMATLRVLVVYSAGLTDLTGLEFATNLTYLYLGYNRISDIAALSGLTNLTELWLHNNQISDITALSGLTNLTYLSLGGNQISDIAALSGLTNLTELYLRGNQISDLAALSGLTNLIWLNLDWNPLSATSVNTHIPALETRGVAVYWTVEIPDANLRAAIEKSLNKARGARITPADMATLTRIEARGTTRYSKINDLTGLEFATNLTGLDLSRNQISDITALAGLTNLTWLDLRYNQISDIAALLGLTNLESLDLWGNPLSATSKNTHIPALQARGVRVIF